MTAPKLSEDEEERLVDELAAALQGVVETSCGEMAPLWLAGTRLARRDLSSTVPDLGFPLSDACARLSRGTQNRYRALACWRHALLWRGVLEQVDPDFARAVTALYFTPYPDGRPPYAWSRRVSSAPRADCFKTADTLKHWAKQGCWDSVERLRSHCRDLPEQTVCDEVVLRIVKTGCRDTLRDVLKLDDHYDPWSEL